MKFALLFPADVPLVRIWRLVALRENLALKQLPPEAGCSKAAVDAVETLLNQLPQDEFTARVMKITENRPKPRARKAK
jgi:hypothetical protein